MANFIVCLVVVLAICPAILTADQTADDKPFLRGQSFELTTKITRLFSSTGSSVHEVNEKYSWGQRRAKIRFRAEHNGQPEEKEPGRGFVYKSGTYFVDKRAEIVLFNDGSTGKCQPSSVNDLYADLGLILIQDFKGAARDNHIVGPAQLLSLVAANKNNLKLPANTSIKNIDMIEYKLDLTDSGSYYVYYNQRDDLKDSETIPIRVAYTDHKVKLYFDFSPLKLLQLDSLTSTLHRQVENGQVALDEFVFPPLSGCSAAIKGDPLLSGHVWPNRFSFIADVGRQQLIGRGLKAFSQRKFKSSRYTSFVAYDENLQSLRVDTMNSDCPDSSGRLLYNFLANKVYYLKNNQPASQATQTQRLITLDQSKGGPKMEPTDCIIGKISGSNNVEVTKQLGDLLTGARDSFVYMGRAQVRGISALVYEVVGARLPFWLEPPVANENAELLEAMNKTNKQASENTNTILYYFGQRDTDHPLLMMEIYHHSREYRRRVFSKQTIEIYDFKWDLETIAPTNGDRASEMFSLRDLCAADDAPSGHVELIVEQHTQDLSKEARDWISTAPLRNQAILSGLQETLDVSVANVFDLESRVESNEEKKYTLHVAFRHANHRRKVKKLVYLGEGNIKTNSEDKLLRFSVHSLRDCFLLASQRKSDIYFAYDPIESVCLLDQQPVDYTKTAREIAEEPNNFVLIEQLHLDIYRVFEDFDFNMAFMSYWTKPQANYASRVELQNKLIMLGYKEPKNKRATFRIKRVHLRETNTARQEQDIILHATTNQQFLLESLKEIQGYGLSMDDFEYNNRIESIELDSSSINPYKSYDEEKYIHKFEITPNHCHSRCLIDPGCQSYSICLVNYGFECILSTLSFKSAAILSKLKTKNKTKSGRKILVTAHDVRLNKTQEINLVKRPACTVYNKQYLDFFKSSEERGKVLASNWAILTVDGREECASLCGKRNFELNRRLVNQPMGIATYSGSDSDNQPVGDKMNWVQYLQRGMCFKFMYMSHIDFMNLPETVRNRFSFEDDKKSQVNGYCMINKENLDVVSSGYPIPANTLDYLDPETYLFDVINMYDESHGFALTGSDLGRTETIAHTKVRNNNGASEDEYEIVRSLAEGDENFQLYSNYGDKWSCARLCFMQTRNPWPACRSFDVVIERIYNESLVRCRFNSVTLNQVMVSQKYHLIENQTDKQMWHYEPRVGLMLDSQSLAAELELSFASRMSAYMVHGNLDHFKIFFVISIALVTGLWVGVLVHQKYLSGLTFGSSIERTNSIAGLVLENNNNHIELGTAGS